MHLPQWWGSLKGESRAPRTGCMFMPPAPEVMQHKRPSSASPSASSTMSPWQHSCRVPFSFWSQQAAGWVFYQHRWWLWPSLQLEGGSWVIPGSDGITLSCCHGFGEKCCFSKDLQNTLCSNPRLSLIPDRVENVPPWLKCSSWVQPKDDIFRKVWEESCGCYWVTIEWKWIFSI